MIRALGLGAFAAGATLYACSDYTSNDPIAATTDGGSEAMTTDAPSGDISVVPDAAGADAAATVDSGLGDCVDFATGDLGGFTLSGSVLPKAQGMVVRVDSSKIASMIRRTYHRDGPISSSSVTIDMTVAGANDFKPDNYADALTLFYGLPAELEKTAVTSLEVLKDHTDVDVWYAAGSGSFDGAHRLPSISGSLDGILAIRSIWAVAGEHDFAIEGVSPVQIVARTATTPANDLTVKIGGFTSDVGAPPLEITVRKICVELQ